MTSSGKSSGPTLIPPANFAMVEEGIFRSAYPTEANVAYLRHIGIRNVVLLSIEALPGPVKRALAADSTGKSAANYITRGPIRVIEVADMRTWRVDGMNSGDDFSRRDIVRALDFAVDRQWHPLLFACPLGELQTNILVGCMRRYQHWALTSIYSECELFTNVCRKLRSSLLFLIEAWDPIAFPISAVNIHYRNHEMQMRDRSRAQQERQRHRRANAAAALAKSRKADLSDSAENSDGDSAEDVDEEAEVHSGTSDVVTDRTAHVADPHLSSGTSSPPQTFNELTTAPRTPPSADLAKVNNNNNPEAALISTSGQRPPMMMRRAAAQRLRDQQQQQTKDGDDPLRAGEGSAKAVTMAELKDSGVLWAEWYLEALRVREELKAHSLRSPTTIKAAATSSFGDVLPPPHVRYADVRNPPAIDSRSKFTKESIVEEDDD